MTASTAGSATTSCAAAPATTASRAASAPTPSTAKRATTSTAAMRRSTAIGDSGGGADTLSFATGVTPGFANQGSFFEEAGFPAGAEGRGVYVDLGEGFGNDGLAPSGGGVDQGSKRDTGFSNFEIGDRDPFRRLHRRYLAAPRRSTGRRRRRDPRRRRRRRHLRRRRGRQLRRRRRATNASHATAESRTRGSGTISAGVDGAAGRATGPALYLTGSDGDDDHHRRPYALGSGHASPTRRQLRAATFAPLPNRPTRSSSPGSAATTPSPPRGFPESTSVILLGGDGDDHLTGGETEDALIDGAGERRRSAPAAATTPFPTTAAPTSSTPEPAMTSSSPTRSATGTCSTAEPDRDNANWANFNAAVAIDMERHTPG